MVVHVYLQNHEVALLLNDIAPFEIFIWYEVIKLLANHLFHTVSTLARKKNWVNCSSAKCNRLPYYWLFTCAVIGPCTARMKWGEHQVLCLRCSYDKDVASPFTLPLVILKCVSNEGLFLFTDHFSLLQALRKPTRWIKTFTFLPMDVVFIPRSILLMVNNNICGLTS